MLPYLMCTTRLRILCWLKSLCHRCRLFIDLLHFGVASFRKAYMMAKISRTQFGSHNSINGLLQTIKIDFRECVDSNLNLSRYCKRFRKCRPYRNVFLEIYNVFVGDTHRGSYWGCPLYNWLTDSVASCLPTFTTRFTRDTKMRNAQPNVVL